MSAETVPFPARRSIQEAMWLAIRDGHELAGQACMDRSDWTYAVFSKSGEWDRLVLTLPRNPPERLADQEADEIQAELQAKIEGLLAEAERLRNALGDARAEIWRLW